MEVLHKILDLMWKTGVSEIDFCTAIGINKSAVTDWKKGKTKSYQKHLQKIADYFNVPIEYFEDSNPTPSSREADPKRLRHLHLYDKASPDDKAAIDLILKKYDD